MSRSTAKISGFLILGLVGVYGAWSGWRLYAAAERPAPNNPNAPQLVLDDGPPITDFTLTDAGGEPFHSESMQGEVWVASFFFTACPGPCLKMNNRIAELQKELADADVTFVSITCDPANDTTEALAKYSAHFQVDSQRWRFLTGELPYISRVARDVFSVAIDRQTHSDRLILVDGDGKVVGNYHATSDADMLAMKKKIAELSEQG